MKSKLMTYDVIILAAGASRRMAGALGQKKQFATIDDIPVYHHAIDSFADHSASGHIILVAPESDLADLQNRHPDITIVAGGAERHLSVQQGLNALKSMENTAPFIAIHDAARPFVPHDVIDRSLAALRGGHVAVVPVLPVPDTIKQVSDTDQDLVGKTLDRSALRRIQTPQFFAADLIHNLHQDVADDVPALLDDAYLAEQADIDVAMITGDEGLAKLTVIEDFAQYQKPTGDQMIPHHYRTGTGFDVHRFTQIPPENGTIMICGLAVPHDVGLDAHSDGDVGIHALCDAIFGALCDGDIGSHFPPSDMKWKDAASDQFLRYATELVQKKGARLIHVDVTLLCERPKIGPLREDMRAILANLCGLPIDAVSVKATTTEQLGFTGRKEGIAAQAAATILYPA